MDSQIVGAYPFPYAVIDNVIPEDLLKAALYDAFQALPAPDDPDWVYYHNPLEEKYALNKREKFPELIRLLLDGFYDQETMHRFEKLLGVKNLQPDPNLLGAGIHKIGNGGKLDIHLDHNRNGKLPGLERKVNAIFWFHPEWQDDWGGDLELWSEKYGKPHECAVQISPKPGRLALFKAGDRSFHGHPKPLTCPIDKYRTSLALYYYSDALEDTQIREKVHFYNLPGEADSPELVSLREARADPKKASSVWRTKK